MRFKKVCFVTLNLEFFILLKEIEKHAEKFKTEGRLYLFVRFGSGLGFLLGKSHSCLHTRAFKSLI